MGITAIAINTHISNLQIGRPGAWLMGLAAVAFVAVACGTDAGAASGPVGSIAGDVAAGTGDAANFLVSENSNSGQSATTLSGGEAQRIKLSKELSRRATGRTVYILDEPTTGLHFEDIRKLLSVLNALVEQGNTVIVIEHNLDVIKTADWIIDLGPEGGEAGGEIMAEGTPEQIAMTDASLTGQFLRPMLSGGRTHAYADVGA